MRSTQIISLICVSLVTSACGLGYKNSANARRPEYATGMGARIIRPGDPGASMPSHMNGPAGNSSSSTASNNGGSSSGSSSNSGGQGGGTGLTMIGGANTEVDGENTEKVFPVPGVLLGYPFWIFGRSNSEKADKAVEERENPRVSAADPLTSLPRTPDDAERVRVATENERLRQELMQNARDRNPARQGPDQVSIGDELAALQRALEHQRRSGAADDIAPNLPAGRTSNVPPLSAPDTADRNGDGQADVWRYNERGQNTRELLDDDHDGVPDRTIYYDARDRVQRTEEDIDGNGQPETITMYRDGEMARRRSDSDGDGQSDAWSFYENGELVRNETDRDGDGFRDLVLIYRGGELVREEEDRNGDGRPDIASDYRGGQVVEKREDLDYDGRPDVVSFYENGKLVRRNMASEEVLEQWSPESGE